MSIHPSQSYVLLPQNIRTASVIDVYPQHMFCVSLHWLGKCKTMGSNIIHFYGYSTSEERGTN